MKQELRDRLVEQVKNQMACRGHTQHEAAVAMGLGGQPHVNMILHGSAAIGFRTAKRLMDYADVSDDFRAKVIRDLVIIATEGE